MTRKHRIKIVLKVGIDVPKNAPRAPPKEITIRLQILLRILNIAKSARAVMDADKIRATNSMKGKGNNEKAANK